MEKDKPLSQLLVKRFHLALILWMLSKEEMHGYDIIKRMESFDMGTIRASRVYPFLRTLERAKLIEHRAEGRRKVYKLTSKGRLALKKLKQYVKNNPLSKFLKELVS